MKPDCSDHQREKENRAGYSAVVQKSGSELTTSEKRLRVMFVHEDVTARP